MNWQALSPQADGLGESPFWHPGEQALYWVDIPNKQVRRARAEGTVESWAMPSEPGCIAPAAGGGYAIALRDGMYRAAAWGGELSLLKRFDHDTATTRFNDGKADPAGRFWAGTMYEPRDKSTAQLFSLDMRGGTAEVERKAGDATIANGLAWSPDEKTVYWTDTIQHTIWAWDWDKASNAMTRQRVFAQFKRKPQGWQYGLPGCTPETYGGRPDGATVDAEGNYWVAMFEGARVLRLSPSGEQLAEYKLPAQCPTMPCFGGADLKTLYVTTASHGRPEAEIRDMPQSGCVFFTALDQPGLPVNFFQG
ncbi:MAG: SMP-30/gluconolactonase/LRE family protein [Comamonadaceae bacterium]|nr:MAG: SMP-30/gluconolactonase/LRE family protein [Comamonadaceae bacterium]